MLFRSILKALHSYHGSVFEEIRNYLHSAEILYYKKLYTQSHKALNKAKKLCARHDIHFYSPAILAWESNLAVATYNLNWVDEIVSESKNEMGLLQNNQQYNLLVMNVMVLINRYGSLQKKNLLKKNRNIFATCNRLSTAVMPSCVYRSSAKKMCCSIAMYTINHCMLFIMEQTCC